MEENKRFSWSDLFIKVIIVIIFILFVVWLLSLSNKKLTNSLDVLTDEIFANNVERMKEVGKEYFTTERLPQKVGELKTLTLQEMYDKKLILELKDKYGKSCNADDSYITIEKLENEYQMKVNLECSKQEDYIIVIMGCYNYCDTDICEKKEEPKLEEKPNTNDKQIEYQYKKVVNGHWTDYGSWSEWSKVEISSNDYRQVETKKEFEKYTYNKIIEETVYEKMNAICPSGYARTEDGTKCYKVNTQTDIKNPTCPTINGYTFINRDGFTCNYKISKNENTNPTCPVLSGYTLVKQDGFTCNYSKSETQTAEPTCPSKSGWNLTGRNGFTCNYSKTVSVPYTYYETVTYSYQDTISKTCYSSKVVIPCTGCAPVTQRIPYDCSTTETKYATKEVPKTGYKNETQTTTGTASCPSGYTQSGNSCVKTSTSNTTKEAVCPTGYTKSGNTCTKQVIKTETKEAVCPNGYTKSGSSCIKPISVIVYKDFNTSCPSGYKFTEDKKQCFKIVDKEIQEEGTREVTYYRYRIREYIGGTVDYKWSKSNNDRNLINAGYYLTGVTR